MTTELRIEPQRRTRRAIESRPEFADILRTEETFSTGESDDVGERVNGWFDRLMLQSGLEFSPTVLLLLTICSAMAVGGACFVAQEHPLAAAIGAGLGALLPIGGAMFARSRRQSTLLKQMPPMVDELARAARTGRSLEQCLQLVARDTPAPLGTELKSCARRLRLGTRLDVALRDLPERTGLTSANVLVMALCVHHQTGGDLVLVLERLARTIRDRLAFFGRLKVATAASRATAVLMLVLPPIVLGFYLFRDGDYLDKLTATFWGRATLIGAIVLQLIGTFFVRRILKNSQRA